MSQILHAAFAATQSIQRPLGSAQQHKQHREIHHRGRGVGIMLTEEVSSHVN